MTFGLKVTGALANWGARAIYHPGEAARPFELLGDRQQFEGMKTLCDDLQNWINMRALPLLREKLRADMLESNSHEVIDIKEYKYVLTASPQGSCGYLYIGAGILPVSPGEPVKCPSSEGNMERVFIVAGKKYVWNPDWGVPSIGDKGTIACNDLGPGRLMGWSEGAYHTPGLSVLYPQVELAKPPKWWIQQMYDAAVEKAAAEKKKKPFKKDFKPGLCSCYAWDFRPEGVKLPNEKQV